VTSAVINVHITIHWHTVCCAYLWKVTSWWWLRWLAETCRNKNNYCAVVGNNKKLVCKTTGLLFHIHVLVMKVLANIDHGRASPTLFLVACVVLFLPEKICTNIHIISSDGNLKFSVLLCSHINFYIFDVHVIHPHFIVEPFLNGVGV
jgi:hypothetical protein